MKRLKYLIAINPPLPRKCVPSPNDMVSFLPMERIGEDGSLDLSEVRPACEVSQGYTAILDGDLVIAKITPCFENGKGAICLGLRGGVGFGTTELIVLRAKQQGDLRFLYWLTRSHEFRNWGEAEMRGSAGQKRVTEEFVANFLTIELNKVEQRRIAAYLDEQTEKIDRLMDMRRRQMALLKEQRSALIQQAVTRGLNPNVPMKDSGLPWLGEIPEHWEVKEIRYLVPQNRQVMYGIVLPGPNVDDGVPIVKAGNCEPGRLSIDSMHRTTFAPRSGIHNYWLWHAVRSQSFFLQMDSVAVGATIRGVNIRDLKRGKLAVPPPLEQKQIADFIASENTKFDNLHATYDRQLTLLTEYRAALIHECVTGQRLVPEAASL